MSTTTTGQGARRFVCALLGSGIGASLTPPMHEAEGDRLGVPLVYRVVDIDVLGLSPDEAVDLVPVAGQLGFTGLNVTHPCKQRVLRVLDELSPEAETIGAVNTVVFDDGRAVGHNTDVTGFARGFRRDLPQADVTRVVQFGAGGAGSAVAHALVRLGADEVVVVDPRADSARELARSVTRTTGTVVRHVSPTEVDRVLPGASGVVNSTPVGMRAHPGTPFDPGLLSPDQWVCDVVYRPLVTELVTAARERGCRTATGAGMAIGQAVDAFALFTGLTPDPSAFERTFLDLVSTERTTDVTA